MWMLSCAPEIASNIAWYVAGPSCRSVTLFPTTSGVPATPSSSARWRSKMLVSSPRLFRRSRMALLCAALSGPCAPSRRTGADECDAMSGTMTGSVLQPAAAASSNAASALEIMGSSVRPCAATVGALTYAEHHDVILVAITGERHRVVRLRDAVQRDARRARPLARRDHLLH